MHRLCPSPSFSSYTCTVEESVLLLHFSLCFCDILLYFSLRSVIHLSACSFFFFSPLPAASSLELYCTEPSYSHLHLSAAEIGREQEHTASVLPPLHSFLPAAVVKHIRPRLRDGKDIPIFLLPVFFFFNSVLLCLTWHNIVEAEVPNNRGRNALPSLPPNYHFISSSYLLSKLVLPLLSSITAPRRMALRLQLRSAGLDLTSHHLKSLTLKIHCFLFLFHFVVIFFPGLHTCIVLKKTLETTFLNVWSTNAGHQRTVLKNPWKMHLKNSRNSVKFLMKHPMKTYL